ncbi:retrotransposon protein, putative, unclassified [Tanacetum coccineum]
MVAAGGNILRKTPQEAYDLIKNMTQHHFQWDAEVYYDTTTGVSSHYSETTFALSALIKVLGKQTAYTIQSVQHQPGPGHPNTVYYSDSDESDEDEPFEVLDIQKPIHSLSGNPTPSFNSMKSSGSTTSHSDHSLSDYEAFCFDVDHIEEKSSGSTTSHFDFSLLEYESFIFDLSIDPFPPANRSDSHHEEFVDELAHIISPPEYDHFYFDIEPDLGELTIVFEENLSKDSTKELTSPELNDFPLLLTDYDFTFSEEFSEIDLLVSFPFGNKDKIFDLGIFIIKGIQSKRFHILPLDDFPTISFVSDSIILTDPSEIKTFLSFPFGNEDKLAKDGLARGIPKLKFQKDHLCSECTLGKSKKSSYQPKAEDTNQEKLYLLHMDLCGPMRVESINGKKYILVIVDDYSRFTWVRFLRSKDETPNAIIKYIKNIQVHLNVTVRNVRTDNGTEFVNQTLCDFYENVGILHQTFVARTP